jgi:hypothetical protein
VAPDLVTLWIGKNDATSLPKKLRILKSPRFVIEVTDDIRSYTKIIPCLMRAPDAYIVTCDDDIYYPPDWLESLLASYKPGAKVISCNRAHLIRLNGAGDPLSYADWEHNTTFAGTSRCIFPTGVGGVLYAPKGFHQDVTRVAQFQKLCPTADDVWLYWMAALNGYQFKTTGMQNRPITWPLSQRTSLRLLNMPRGGGNDIQIRNMIAEYGRPYSSHSS